MPQAPVQDVNSTQTAKAAAVLAVLHAFAGAYARRDLDGVMAHFAPDNTLILIGTGPDERRIGPEQVRAQIQRDFDQSEAIGIEWNWHAVTVSGRFAWVAAEARVTARVQEHEMQVPMRVTFVCEQRKRTWLVVQGHLSLPAPGQTPGHSFPA